MCVLNGTDSCELPPKEELARRPESHRLAFQTKKWSSAGSSSSSSNSSKIAAFPYSDNGSGAERAEKEKRGKNLECKNGLFLSNSGYR